MPTKYLYAILFFLSTLFLTVLMLMTSEKFKKFFDTSSSKNSGPPIVLSTLEDTSQLDSHFADQSLTNQERTSYSSNTTITSKLIRLLEAVFAANTTPNLEIKLQNFIKSSIVESPIDLIKAIEDLKTPLYSVEQQTHLYQSTIAAWANIDFDQLQIWLENNNQAGKLDTALNNLTRTTEMESNTRLQLAEHITDLHKQELAIQSIIRSWVTDDARSAADWAISNTNVFHIYGEDIFTHVIEADIFSAITSLASFETETLIVSGRIINLLSAKISEESTSQETIYDSTIAILSLPQSDFKDEIVHTVFPTILNRLSISDTKSLLLEMPAGENKKSLNLLVANRLAMKDAPQALDFAESIEDGPTKLAATESVVNHWAKHDLQSASKWLKSNKQVSEKSTRVMIKAALTKKDIHVAKTWISRLNKNERAEELHMEMIRLLNETDKNQALDYLDKNSGFTPQEKEAVLGYLSQR